MYGKLLDRNRKLVEARLDDMLKAQRQAVGRAAPLADARSRSIRATSLMGGTLVSGRGL